MALPREHHNGLSIHFLLTLTLNWTTYDFSTNFQFRCQRSKTFNKKRGARINRKISILRRLCHRPFSGSVRWRRTHRYCQLAMVYLVSPLQSQWYCHFLKMPVEASLTSSKLARGLGPSTNVRIVSAMRQLTAGRWKVINSAFERSWAGSYGALFKMCFKQNNYLTGTMYTLPPGSGTFLFTDAFTKRYNLIMNVLLCHILHTSSALIVRGARVFQWGNLADGKYDHSE